MVHFKVIKGSRLLLIVAVAILAAVVALIGFDLLAQKPAETVSTQVTEEAETQAVFASSVEAKKPSVLIYHTHTHEAYEPTADDPYDAVETWRTTDNRHNVVYVGDVLRDCLTARGFDVVHDTTDHEQSDLKTAYSRSLTTLESYDEPFDLYIDLHRDAYSSGMKKNLSDGDESLAQLMLLVGTGEGFHVKPNEAENLAFAEALTERVNQIKPDLCRPVMVKKGRYNQHIGVPAILLEVGHNRNTLAEAVASLPYFADALEELMRLHPIK